MSKKKGLVKVLPLLFVYLSLHSLDSRLKEEINQVLIRSFGADTTQVIAVCTFALLGDDDNGMPLHMKDVVSEKSSQPTIAIPERMQVFIKRLVLSYSLHESRSDLLKSDTLRLHLGLHWMLSM